MTLPSKKKKNNKKPALRTHAALHMVDKNSRSMAKIAQLIEILHMKNDKPENEKEILMRRIEKLKKRVNRRLQKLAKWADTPPEERALDLRSPPTYDRTRAQTKASTSARYAPVPNNTLKVPPSLSNYSQISQAQSKQLQDLREQIIRQKTGVAPNQNVQTFYSGEGSKITPYSSASIPGGNYGYQFASGSKPVMSYAPNGYGASSNMTFHYPQSRPISNSTVPIISSGQYPILTNVPPNNMGNQNVMSILNQQRTNAMKGLRK